MQGIIPVQTPGRVLNFGFLTKQPVFREAIVHKTNPHQEHTPDWDTEAAEGAIATTASNTAPPVLPAVHPSAGGGGYPTVYADTIFASSWNSYPKRHYCI